jgi:hypothetical protein
MFSDFKLKYVKTQMPLLTSLFSSKERPSQVCNPGAHDPFGLFTRFHADAHGDILRGLQVVESACNIPTALMGDKIEVSRDMDTETRRLPLGVCAR